MKRLSIMTGLWILVGFAYAASVTCVCIAMFGKWAGGHTMDWLDALDAKRAGMGRRA